MGIPFIHSAAVTEWHFLYCEWHCKRRGSNLCPFIFHSSLLIAGFMTCELIVLIKPNRILCGNKMPTRCNRWISFCRSYCLLNMFRAPLCPSSGARDYYTGGCCLSCLVLGFQVVGMVWSWGLCVRFAGNSGQTGHTTLSSTPYRQLENQAPNTTGSNHLYNTLELLIMGTMVPETCWASNKICKKKFICCI